MLLSAVAVEVVVATFELDAHDAVRTVRPKRAIPRDVAGSELPATSQPRSFRAHPMDVHVPS
jgi:hypothetical protein